MEIGQNDWNDKLTELHKLLREGNLKEFHSLVNRMTKVKQGNPVVRGIVNEEGPSQWCKKRSTVWCTTTSITL